MSLISLLHLNTFRLKAYANKLISVTAINQLEQLLPFKAPFLVLGGGSNMLFSEDYLGTILANNLQGIEQWEDEENHYFRVAGGENWHNFVMHCVDLNIGGLENLALIPGSVGAAPVQNIGAYGVELSQLCHEVISYDINTGLRHVMNNTDCQFAYRESLFKQQRHFFIAEVVFRLTKQWQPQLSYGELKAWSHNLQSHDLNYAPTPKEVAQVIIDVRNKKLPDPTVLPNVGSFFKNPVITNEQAQQLKQQYNDMPQYPMAEGVKVAAGWLIDQLGLKGKKIGGASVHQHQALVLVNSDNASSIDVTNLANFIISAVEEAFNITLEPEVNVINNNGYSQLKRHNDGDNYV